MNSVKGAFSIASQYMTHFTHRTADRLSELHEYAPPLYILRKHLSYLKPRQIEFLICAMSVYSTSNKELSQAIYSSQEESPFWTLFVCLSIGLLSKLCKRSMYIPREWEIRKLANDQSKKFVVLHCTPYADRNGGCVSIGSRRMQILKKLGETHSIVHKVIKATQDINNAIDEIQGRGQEVSTLIIHAHGNEKSIQLSGAKAVKGKPVVPEGCDTIRDVNFSKLATSADIVLVSCSTGKKSHKSLSFAEWVQFYAGPFRKVYAAKEICYNDYISYDPIEKKWSFQKPWIFKLSFSDLDITADINYDDTFRKVVSIGHSVGVANWAGFLLFRIAQAWNSFSTKIGLAASASSRACWGVN